MPPRRILVLMVTAAVAAMEPEPVKQQRTLQTGGNVAGGLLVGPAMYLLLWVLPLCPAAPMCRSVAAPPTAT
jgi:hypothetical protein